MASGNYDLQILQGKLFDKTFTWKIDGTPVDLTGYSAKLRIYNSAGTALLNLSTTLDGSGNGIILGSDGTVRLVIKTAKTATLTFTKAKYELQLTRPDAEDLPFLAGNVYVTKEYIDP
jgi:hypothetical protein